MVRIAQFAVAASIASLVAAAPAANEKRHTLPVRKGTSGKAISAKAVVERDQARIANYNARSGGIEKRASSGSAINEDVSYVAAIKIGTQTFDLIVDTGSSNLWVRFYFCVSLSWRVP